MARNTLGKLPEPDGNQVRSGVAVGKADAAEAAGSSEMPVPTVIGTGFAGVKRSQDEAEVCDELRSVKTTRSLDSVCGHGAEAAGACGECFEQPGVSPNDAWDEAGGKSGVA